jgi:hypothetical protein
MGDSALEFCFGNNTPDIYIGFSLALHLQCASESIVIVHCNDVTQFSGLILKNVRDVSEMLTFLNSYVF